MNIFVLANSPRECAQSMFDSHVSKMVLETAQLLSCAVRYLAPDQVPINSYKETHKNHPCSVWARKHKANFNWLRELGLEIALEYTHRYGKVHASTAIIKAMPILACSDPITYQPKAVADEYKNIPDVIAAYRAYYFSKLKDLSPSKTMFTNRQPPEWLSGYYNFDVKKDKFVIAPFV